MTRLVEKPTIIKAAGNPPKLIEEYIGRVNSSTDEVSIAKMTSPAGWSEPGQTPEFDEYTLVLKGSLHVSTKAGDVIVERRVNGRRSVRPREDGSRHMARTTAGTHAVEHVPIRLKKGNRLDAAVEHFRNVIRRQYNHHGYNPR